MTFVTAEGSALVIDTYPCEEACADLTLAFARSFGSADPGIKALADDVLALVRGMELEGTPKPDIHNLGCGQVVHAAPEPIPTLLRRARRLGVI